MVGKHGSHDTKSEWKQLSGVNLVPYPPLLRGYDTLFVAQYRGGLLEQLSRR